ncbi:MAG TPA: phytanoyl-CoA dioxygenase family protein [Capsulimonadaceae bacterium]|nr:phytanoyl-CoA dioxygenase family protein [Capsulimonadaceae bacterium]
MDTRNILQSYKRDGFVIVADLLSAEEARAIKEETARILEEVREEARRRGEDPQSATAGGVYVGLSARSEKMRELARNPRMLDVLAAILAPDIEFLSDKVVFKSSKTDFSTPWHQDWPYWEGAHKVSVWLALDNADIENGCMKLIPASHHAVVHHDGSALPDGSFPNQLKQESVDESNAVCGAVPAGGAVFFHDLALHASYPNRSGRDRWAWIGTYRDARAGDHDYDWAVAAMIVRGSAG